MKKKLLRNVSIVALSAVMTCGAAVSFAGCGQAKDAYAITISMFCGNSDVDVNQDNCNTWAKQYTQKLIADGTIPADKEITVTFSYQTNDGAYFEQLSNQIASNSQPDVFYVSPKYVKSWVTANKIVDMSPSLAENSEELMDIWEDSLAFYSYSKDPGYTSGDRIQFDQASNTFKTIKNGTTVGIYGLPKDYSNFGLGFNDVFFSDKVRSDLMTKTTNDRTGVSGAEYGSAKLTYNGETGVVLDADGNDAPLINIGKPTYYKPYNFYAFANYDAAVAGGDPMATAVDYYTDGLGYCVTIPGFPGDTFEDAAKYWDVSESDVAIPEDHIDPEAEYDTTKGYITFTYAEFSALTWVMTYYLNTYDWQGNGKGGAKTATGVKNVYGNDQYDGVLYLLPWLAGNDAQYLNEDSTNAINGSDSTKVGTDTYKMNHKKMNGETEEVDIQYGINSERYIETVGAFHAYGSDWNGNSNNCGDTTQEKSSGWDLFVAGNCVFYGVGTWNAGPLNATEQQYLQYRLMPEPVSEDFALASYIKNAKYEMEGYGACDNSGSVSKTQFTGKEIFESQLERQDQWGARMDSVGYGVSALAGSVGGEWRKEAAIDLVKFLTITPETQVTLTYAGSQLPNFKSQCRDFYRHEGDFADMITPEDAAWEEVYGIAKQMYAAAQNSATSGQTVGAWLSANAPSVTNYDKSFEGTPLSSLMNLSYPMKILHLVSYTKADRDLSLRMQYGLNATRDSAMYTYDDDWLGVLDPRGKNLVMAYANCAAFDGKNGKKQMGDILKAMLVGTDASNKNKLPIVGQSYGTPEWFCLRYAADSQTKLQEAINEEKAIMGTL